jgi:hypothetical protein
MEHGFSPPEIENTRIKFKNFWDAKAGKDARKLDWSKTWRVWISNERRPRQAELRLVTTYEGSKHGTSRNAGGFARDAVRFGSQRAASQGGYPDDP